MKKFTSACIALLAIGTAWGGPITPSFDTFGTLSGATFGGSGIPNDAVAITTVGGVTLGITATPRYSAPSVGNNGAGVFYATPGEGTVSGYSLWNFSFYASNNSGQDVNIELLYDFDPGADTERADLGSITSTLADATVSQNSWNLGMGFLAVGFPPISAPSYLPFDPTASGEYSFALILKDGEGNDLARSSINVNVGAVPDAASTALLLLASLAGLTAVNRRRS